MRKCLLAVLSVIPLCGCIGLVDVVLSQSAGQKEDCKPAGDITVESETWGPYQASIYRFPGGSYGGLVPKGVNNAGTVVGLAALGTPDTGLLPGPCTYGFKIESGSWSLLPSASNHSAYLPGAINNLDQVTVSKTANGSFGMQYSKISVLDGGTEHELPMPNVDAGCSVDAINDAGTIAGTVNYPSLTQVQLAFSNPFTVQPTSETHLARWNPMGDGWEFEDLGLPPGVGTSAYAFEVRGINIDGQIAGTFWLKEGGTQPFLWEAGNWTLLPLGDGNSGSVSAINDGGQIVGQVIIGQPNQAPTTVKSVLWSRGGATDVSSLTPAGINNCGDIAGADESGAAILRGGVVTRLNSLVPTSANLFLANAININDAGQILVLAGPPPNRVCCDDSGNTLTLDNAQDTLVVLTPLP